jgi:hypothetical protein
MVEIQTLQIKYFIAIKEALNYDEMEASMP